MNWVGERQGRPPAVRQDWPVSRRRGQAGAAREPGAGGGRGLVLWREAGSRPCPPEAPTAPRGLFYAASGESDSWLVASALWLLPQELPGLPASLSRTRRSWLPHQLRPPSPCVLLTPPPRPSSPPPSLLFGGPFCVQPPAPAPLSPALPMLLPHRQMPFPPSPRVHAYS